MKQLIITFLLTLIFVALEAQSFEMVKDINPNGNAFSYSYSLQAIVYKGKLFFTANDGSGDFLYYTDGTSEGTQKFLAVNLRGSSAPIFHIVNDKLIFTNNDTEHNAELWVTDGTTKGTHLLKDIHPTRSSEPRYIKSWNGKLYFSANDGAHGNELWVSDGTPEGTHILKDIHENGSSNPSNFTVYNGKVYFKATDAVHGDALWVTDGTAAGTSLAINIKPYFLNYPMLVYKNKLYFTASDNIHGYELWATDGTEAGTHMIKDIHPNGSSNPIYLTLLSEKIFFTADDGIHGTEIWVTDGTSEGTHLVKDIRLNETSVPVELIAFSGKLYYAADDGIHGEEIWVTDGMTETTTLLKDIHPEYGSHYEAYSFAEYSGKLYFAANEDYSNQHLWVTDGTPEGTQRLMPANYTPADDDPLGSVGEFFVYNNALYFSAVYDDRGIELWKYTDATVTNIDSKASNNLGFSLYPNPVKDRININYSDNIDQIKLIDINGRIIRVWNNYQSSIDIKNLDAGTYFIQITTDERTGTKLFIKN